MNNKIKPRFGRKADRWIANTGIHYLHLLSLKLNKGKSCGTQCTFDFMCAWEHHPEFMTCHPN
jgi:hypothetical protein